MKIRNILLIHAGVILVLAFTTTSCKKKTTPPAPTPTASVPSYSFTAGGITIAGVQYTISNPSNGPLVITATNGLLSTNANYQMIQITVNDVVQQSGTISFALNSTAGATNGNVGLYTSGPETYNTDSGHTGNVSLTVDVTNRKISATFSYSTVRYNSPNINTIAVSGSFTNVGY